MRKGIAMTYNEKKRFLEGYIYSVRRIKGLQNQLEEWGTIATNITQKIKPVMIQNGTNSSKIENCAIKIAEIENELIPLAKEFKNYREEHAMWDIITKTTSYDADSQGKLYRQFITNNVASEPQVFYSLKK